MPYENEPSDLKSSGSNVENIISGSLFNSIAYKDNIKIYYKRIATSRIKKANTI